MTTMHKKQLIQKVVQDSRAQQQEDEQEHILFDKQQFFNDLIAVALYFLVFRVFFAFLFAFLFAQEWHIEKAFGWLPIIAFNTDASTFITMNSYAIVAAAAAIFGMFIFYSMKKGVHVRPRLWAWYAGVLMGFVQYVILVFLNDYLNFGIRSDLWLGFSLFLFGASIIIAIREYYWRKEIMTLS